MNIGRAINTVFSVLFLFLPLLFSSSTSELFEFNKLLFVYTATTIISFLWIIACISSKKIIFKRTLIDIPLLLFLISQLISTLLSIEPRTSFLGYYSRWNGGLLSLVSYSVLYWAYVSWSNKVHIKRHLLCILASTTVVSIWGIMEHFGSSPSCLLITGNIKATCWVQDVQLRVFASFGQPNWMAAWLVAIIPLSYALFIQKLHLKRKNSLVFLFVSVLSFIALLFTKSRSGLVAIAVSDIIFWAILFKYYDYRVFMKSVISIHITLFVALGIFGTPWSPSLIENINTAQTNQESAVQNQLPALESGGTESGEIRKIVWTGAINTWKIYPIFGSGVETFALSYYLGRPVEHNLTSEWNFLYNKAHNEYLNFLTTTGIVGFLTYLSLLVTISLIILTNIHSQGKANDKNTPILIGLGSGAVGLFITNFFGFSVVPTQILLFIFPAIAVVLRSSEKRQIDLKKLDRTQKIASAIATSAFLYTLLSIFNLLRADISYAKSITSQSQLRIADSMKEIIHSIEVTPNEPIYHDHLAQISAQAALQTLEQKDNVSLDTFVSQTLTAVNTVQRLAPYNIKLGKSQANVYSDLGEIDTSFLLTVESTLLNLQSRAPTDPAILYQTGLVHAKLNLVQKAIADLEKAVQMKPNYKQARRLLAFLYAQVKEPGKAKEQLQYILTHISPDDTLIQEELKKLK